MSRNKSKNNNSSNNNQNSDIKKVSKTDKAKQDILKQYGLADDYKATPELEKVETIREEKHRKDKIPESCHADEIGWNKPKTLLKNALYGIFMGLSDGVPGYSGGTTLNFVGFYEKLITNIKMIFKPDVKRYFWKYLVWFLPFLIAWVGTLIGFMFIVRAAGNANNGVVLAFLFGSFALFSIPLFIISNKKRMVNFKDFIKDTKRHSKTSIIHWILLVLAFVVIIVIGIVARFVSQTEVNGEIIYGVTFVNNQFDVNLLKSDVVSNVIPLLIFAFLAGFAVLVPGLSGSMILFMCNWYTKIASIVSSLFSGEQAGIDGLPYLVVVILGMILGIITSTLCINWLINKYTKYFYSAATGFVAGAFIAIFVSLSNYDYGFLNSNSTTLGLSIGMIFLALILNLVIFVLLNEFKMIDYPKFRIFNRHSNSKSNSVKN